MDSSMLQALYLSLIIPKSFLQALFGVCLFAWPLPVRKRFPVRFIACALGGAVVVSGLNLLRSSFGLPYRLILLAACGLVMLSVRLCWEVPWDMALLAGADGYLAQHMVGSCKTLLRIYLPTLHFPNLLETLSPFGEELLCWVLVYAVLALLCRGGAGRLHLLDRSARLAFTGSILLLCFGMSHLVKTIEGRSVSLASDAFYALGCSCKLSCPAACSLPRRSRQ